MKLPSNINYLGLDTPPKIALFCLLWLEIGTKGSRGGIELKPKQLRGSVSPAQPAVIGNGTSVNPQFPAVAAVPPSDVAAIMSKPIAPPPPSEYGFRLYQQIINNGQGDVLTWRVGSEYNGLFLPYDASARQLEIETDFVNLDPKFIREITTPNLDIGNYLGQPFGQSQTNINVNQTVEQLLFRTIKQGVSQQNDPNLPGSLDYISSWSIRKADTAVPMVECVISARAGILES